MQTQKQVEIMAEILLRTKLNVPLLRSTLVNRGRLIELANGNLLNEKEFQRKLTLVSAPAGYGKTTLVTEWLSRQGIPISWLSLDEADNDASRFLAYFIAAVHEVNTEFGASLQAVLKSPQSPPQEVLLTLIINELTALPTLLMLVLDDYQVIKNLTIHRFLSFLLDHLPTNVHLVLITREDPLISISRLRARGEVLEIRQNDMRFNLEEITDFFSRVMQLELSTEDIIALERRTEGWIAGIQLAGLSLSGVKDKSSFIHEFTGSNRFILDYLIEEVFSQQPAEMRDFLLRTAILDRLCGPICDVLNNRSDSQDLLERLDLVNMFIIPLDQSRTWYRFHRLFSELLDHQRHLRMQPGEEIKLHQIASQWFESEGYTGEAIQHSLAAQDWKNAAQLIGQVNEDMLKHGEVLTLLSWMQSLPVQVLASQPDLYLAYAWALLLSGKYKQAEAVLQDVKQFAAPKSVLLGQVATAQAYLARSVGDNRGVIAKSQIALDLLPDSEVVQRSNLLMNLGLAYWHDGLLDEAEPVLNHALEMASQSNNLYAQLTTEIFLARVSASRGALHRAAEKYPSIIKRGGSVPINALAYLDLGWFYYEWNELERAEGLLHQGLELSRRTSTVEFEIAGLILQTYILLARQEWDKANRASRKAWDLAQEFSMQTRGRCVACQAQVALAMGKVEVAAKWLDLVPVIVDAHTFYRFAELIRARLLLALGKEEAAAEKLEAIYQQSDRAGRGYAVVATRVLQSLAATNEAARQAYLADAVKRAEPDGYIRTFVDDGIALVPVLRQLAEQGIAPEYISRIVIAMGMKQKAAVVETAPITEPLSEREIEVLRLVAEGLSNREIAGRLFISPGTAKTHVHNLCGKLGVRNRTEAATRAIELGLG
jgi:LuxR family maltose regulon positive regulatory protein